LGPPYFRMTEAVRDAVATGNLLSKYGHEVEVFVETSRGELTKVERSEQFTFSDLLKPNRLLIRYAKGTAPAPSFARQPLDVLKPLPTQSVPAN
jgi:hypothetical protein